MNESVRFDQEHLERPESACFFLKLRCIQTFIYIFSLSLCYNTHRRWTRPAGDIVAGEEIPERTGPFRGWVSRALFLWPSGLCADTAARALSRCARTKQKQSAAARFYLIQAAAAFSDAVLASGSCERDSSFLQQREQTNINRAGVAERNTGCVKGFFFSLLQRVIFTQLTLSLP